MDAADVVRSPDACPICAKHRGVGPLWGPVVHADATFVVSLRPGGPAGYAFLEPRRHVANLADLDEAEAQAYGLLTVRLARALQAELDAEHVHTLVAGLAVPHLHEHVFVRHRGTPPEHPWDQPWSGAPTGDPAELAARLARHFPSAP